jgi:hypothetical protein
MTPLVVESRPAPHAPVAGDSVPRWAAWCVAAALGLLLLSIMGLVRAVSIDVFHEMALFREALALGRIPRDDVFAYTSTVSPAVHHEWGVGAVLYLVVVGAGLGELGLGLLRAVLVGIVVACTVAVARRRGAGGAELALLAPLAMILLWTGLAPVRAHLFTFALLGLLLYFLELDRTGERRWLLAWPGMAVAWVNLHGGWVVGAGVLGLAAIERFAREWRAGGMLGGWRGTRHLFAASAATVPLALLNPWGWDYLPYLWHALLLDRPRMTEWAPLWSSQFGWAPAGFFLATVLVAAYAATRGREWRRVPGPLVLVVTGVLAVRSIRILPIYSIVWFSYVSAAVADTPLAAALDRWWRRHYRPVAAAALLVAVIGFVRAGPGSAFWAVVPTESGDSGHVYPAGAVGYLAEAGFEGNLMTPFSVGAYVSWHLYPSVKVGLDSRYEVAFDPGFVEDAFRFYEGADGWDSFLERVPSDAVLVARQAPLHRLLEASAGDLSQWTLVYMDDAYSVFVGPEWAARLPPAVSTEAAPPPAGFP